MTSEQEIRAAALDSSIRLVQYFTGLTKQQYLTQVAKFAGLFETYISTGSLNDDSGGALITQPVRQEADRSRYTAGRT